MRPSEGSSGTAAVVSSDNPVPSITLSITQDDVKRVLEASDSLKKRLDQLMNEQGCGSSSIKNSNSRVEMKTKALQESHIQPPTENEQALSVATGCADENDVSSRDPPLRTVSASDASACSDDESKDPQDGAVISKTMNKRPLHDLIYEAARLCDNSMLQSFLERMRWSGSSTREIRAGVMVFSDIDLNSKIKRIFDVLGDETHEVQSGTTSCGDKENKERSLSREGALSLFRAVIVAISSCIQKNARVQIEMDREIQRRPSKRVKPNSPESDCSNKSTSQDNIAGGNDSVPSLQSPSASFDSTVAPTKDEEGLVTSSVRKEFEDIAVYATDRLVKYTQKKSGEKKGSVCITFNLFQDWRRAEGARIAPWLDLLNLARWKTPQRPATDRSTTSQSQQQHSHTGMQQLKQGSYPHLPTLQRPIVESKEPVEPTVLKQPTPIKASPLKNKQPLASKPSDLDHDRDVTVPFAVPSVPLHTETPLYVSAKSSRTVLSFDFSGSGPGDNTDDTFCITITEENLNTFRNLVRTTGLIHRSCSDVTTILFEASKSREDDVTTHKKFIPIERFHTCLHQLLGSGSVRKLSKIDKDIFSSCFVDFFTCFNTGLPPLQLGEAFVHDLAVGFCFLCTGNKSSKLSTGFELLECQRGRGLSNDQLVQFLRSYLTMLVGISLLTSSPDGIMKPKLNARTRKAMHAAVDNGARWTLRHFLKNSGLDENDMNEVHSFEAFASWYSTGGFNVAPWLELLDLKKLLSLVGEDEPELQSSDLAHERLPSFPGPRSMSPGFVSPRQKSSQLSLTHAPSSHSQYTLPPISSGGPSTPFGYPHPPPPAEVLFTFPLANQCSLVVLREDASYVRGVVDQLSLLSFPPEEVWSTLFEVALSRPPVPPALGTKSPKIIGPSKTMLVDKATFVDCMQEAIQKKGVTSKKRSASGVSRSLSGTRDVLTNFFQSFDLLQIDRVALNELMGGLTLLCGGKKSTKLAFAFSVFDRRQNNSKKRGKKTPNTSTSLDGEELFLFLRSFLIVMFSCCRQSWDLTDDAVNRYIADTANMVTDDVMRYQWRSRKKERIDFDEFGQWYNQGGFESAPWLELLDLRKWVLVEDFEILERHGALDSPGLGSAGSAQDPDCPPPPPDADVDQSFFDDDGNDIMPMDSIDEMDLLLMQQPSHEKEDRALSKLVHSFPFSPKPSPEASPPARSNSVKFHVVTDDNHSGYVVSLSQKRIRHLRHILMESGLHQIDGEVACREILAQAYRDSKSRSRSSHYVLTKDDFDSAMRRVISSRSMSVDTQRALSDILNEIFFAFDYDGMGRADAFDVACGFTVLCQGKKSDKLEYAFEILDWAKRGYLSRADTTRYLRSFLTVLLNIVSTDALDSDFVDDVMTTMNGEKCDKSIMTMGQVVDLGCQWASDQAMASRDGNRESISFDDFADWYTRVGYSNIPWLELLDLNKWVVLSELSSA
jgi:Ca2+-binding EF-hand superfamily protein